MKHELQNLKFVTRDEKDLIATELGLNNPVMFYYEKSFEETRNISVYILLNILI